VAAGLKYSHVDSPYEVEGQSAEELHRDLIRRGPVLETLPVYALTEWEIRWRLDVTRRTRRSTRCELQPEVQLTVRTRLPRWAAAGGEGGSLREEWQRFLTALRVHETGHRDIGLEAAREILRTLRSFDSSECLHLAERADQAALATLKLHQQRNRQYDLDTVHGQAQGVIWKH